jgi:osmotically-inducible protein OsmY
MSHLKMLGSNALGMVLGVIITGASVFAQDGIHTVIGELLKYQVGGFLVRDANGRDVHIEVSQETKMNPAPLVGDQIEAEIAANGTAMAITKLNSSRNEGASQPSATIAIESNADQSEADENLRYRIEERFRTDDRLDWEVLDVQVTRGEVTLYGEVQTEDQKGLASLIATTVPGVVGIRDSIIVEPGPYTTDHGLQKAIWTNLRSVDALRQQTNRLKVQVKNQVATLSGSVEQSLQKEAAMKAAEAVAGVQKVINVIQVRHLDAVGEREKLRQHGIEQVP